MADVTDFSMFRSYEPGKPDQVIFIADYLPLPDAFGEPNYFNLDDSVIYEIKIDAS